MLSSLQVPRLRILLAAGLISAISLSTASATSVFTTVDVTGAGTGAMQGTAVVGIDTAGDVAGVWVDANNVPHGFVRAASTGATTKFDVTAGGTCVATAYGTTPTGMDAAGNIVGLTRDANGIYHGFVRAASTGAITCFNVAGAGTNQGNGFSQGTKPVAINATSGIVGTYDDANNVYYGFVRANGTISTFSAPDAGTSKYAAGNQGTQPNSINDSGAIAGNYDDSSSVMHGFIRSSTGTITEFDAPNAGSCRGSNSDHATSTFVSSIDAAGDVAGFYYDASCVQHGFLRAANGTFTILNAPGANAGSCAGGSGMELATCSTFGGALDAAGDIVGGYTDPNGVIHGFIRPVATGIITSFDDPNAGTAANTGTMGRSILSTSSGLTIVGVYVDANGVLHGFIY